jgi:hypothetical protein
MSIAFQAFTTTCATPTTRTSTITTIDTNKFIAYWNIVNHMTQPCAVVSILKSCIRVI